MVTTGKPTGAPILPSSQRGAGRAGRAGQGERRKPERASFPFKSPDGRRPDPAARGEGERGAHALPNFPSLCSEEASALTPRAPPPGPSPAPQPSQGPTPPAVPVPRARARGLESERHLPDRPAPCGSWQQHSQVHVRPARSGGGQAGLGLEGSRPRGTATPGPARAGTPWSPGPCDPNFPHSSGAGSFRASRALGWVSAATSELGNKEGARLGEGSGERQTAEPGQPLRRPKDGEFHPEALGLVFS